MRIIIVASVILLVLLAVVACNFNRYGSSKNAYQKSGMARHKKHNGSFRIY